MHRLDAAVLFRLALESAVAGATAARFHAVADEGIPLVDIARVIGQRLDVPAKSVSHGEAEEHFGFLAHFASLDAPASSKITQERLRWRPAQPGLIADLDSDAYFPDGK